MIRRTNMKKFLLAFIMVLIVAGCSAQSQTDEIKIGMVTDIAGVDDKSFSEITWKGISEFAEEHEDVKAQYVTPSDTSTATLVSAVDNLVLSGNEVIVLTGFTFEETAGEVAKVYPDVKFILIDGQPLVDGEYVSYDNVSSIFFNEHEAGFLAGVASALETKTGKVGFLGGVEVPAVQKYGWGYVAGIAYANKTFNREVVVADYVYQGTFTDFTAGQTIAGGMFDKGIDIIQHAGGAVGAGAIGEAKQREDVYIVGVDTDQYDDGLLPSGESVILTSAMKHIDVAIKHELEDVLKGKFVSGVAVTSLVGLPQNNPNISTNTANTIVEVQEHISEQVVTVPSSLEELVDFLDTYEFDYSGLDF